MVWETLAARAPGWLTNLVRLWLVRPRPDLRILELKETGGHEGAVTFSADVANYGTQECRPEIKASVGERQVEARATRTDLLPNTGPMQVEISVPRPELGDLVTALNHATTLYGETLRLEVRAGKHEAKPMTWSEELYDPKTDRARYEAQQREWRFARGEETPGDRRADVISRMEQRRMERDAEEDEIQL